MEKRSFGKLQLTRETLKNLTTEQLNHVVGGNTQQCTTNTSIDHSVCQKCQETPYCETDPSVCDQCLTPACSAYSNCNC